MTCRAARTTDVANYQRSLADADGRFKLICYRALIPSQVNDDLEALSLSEAGSINKVV